MIYICEDVLKFVGMDRKCNIQLKWTENVMKICLLLHFFDPMLGIVLRVPLHVIWVPWEREPWRIVCKWHHFKDCYKDLLEAISFKMIRIESNHGHLECESRKYFSIKYDHQVSTVSENSLKHNFHQEHEITSFRKK